MPKPKLIVVAGPTASGKTACAVELCLQADRDMKASRDDPERVLEVLLAALAQEARSGTR